MIGGADYNDPRLAVPGSFINAQDFNTVQELAKYLIKVDNNFSKSFYSRSVSDGTFLKKDKNFQTLLIIFFLILRT